MKKIFLIVGFFGCVGFFGFLVSGEEERGVKTVSLVAPDAREVQVEAEIADDPAEQSRGLMFRQSLPEDAGMLFVFEKQQQLSFWMKNTLIPLDILFFDGEGNFVSSATMEPCRSDPCAMYPSLAPAKYALEVNAGFVEQESVTSGWKMSLH